MELFGKKISILFTVIKRHSFVIVTVFLIWFYVFHLPNGIAQIFLINERTITFIFFLVIIPFMWFYCFFIFLKKKIDLNLMITVSSILTALVFFMIQDYDQTISKLTILQHSSYLNCQKAELLAAQNPYQAIYPQTHFNTQIYKEDLDFISQNFPISTLYAAQDAIAQMEIANNYMDTGETILIQNNLKQTQQLLTINSGLIDLSKKITKTTCIELNPIFTITNQYTNASFFYVFKKYLNDITNLIF